MTREEIIAIFKVLKTAYPQFYREMTKDDMINTINLWQEMFLNDNAKLVTIAVKNLINTFKFPPTIAEIKDEMYKLTNVEENATELWNKIKKAISNSIYHSGEEFEKLPELCKKYVGTPRQLKEWAMESNFDDGVARGQFIKQIEIIKKRKKEINIAIPEAKKLLLKYSGDNILKLSDNMGREL